MNINAMKKLSLLNLTKWSYKMELINKKENVFGDDIAFVEQYD